LTSEQLLATRATLWRQKAEPLLTLDDAHSWLLQSGLCLFLPRKSQIPAPAPSFVEACLGETNPTPPRVSIETAKNLLARLIEANSALPLNLLGTASDHPDFLVSIEALPFVYALRGDRDWKHAPGTAGANRVSPLVTHIWKLLERRGVLTAGEIQEELGRELTEAAVLRALHELWAALRVVPLYQSDGQQTLWEPLQSRHQKAINSGVGMSQVTALSVLASVYLQSVVAGPGPDAQEVR
jgi:23S rRNA pseudouridine2605 synthase